MLAEPWGSAEPQLKITAVREENKGLGVEKGEITGETEGPSER